MSDEICANTLGRVLNSRRASSIMSVGISSSGPANERRPVTSFVDLEVWRRGVVLACDVVRASRTIPRIEQHALASQLRRAAVSIPSNIAEGWGRGSRREFLRYLAISRGSLLELHTQLVIARDVDYLS